MSDEDDDQEPWITDSELDELASRAVDLDQLADDLARLEAEAAGRVRDPLAPDAEADR